MASSICLYGTRADTIRKVVLGDVRRGDKKPCQPVDAPPRPAIIVSADPPGNVPELATKRCTRAAVAASQARQPGQERR